MIQWTLLIVVRVISNYKLSLTYSILFLLTDGYTQQSAKHLITFHNVWAVGGPASWVWYRTIYLSIGSRPMRHVQDEGPNLLPYVM